MKKYWIVNIQVQAGEYQKHVTKLVEAETESQASRNAIEGEAHTELEWIGDYEATEANWSFNYQTKSVKPVKDEKDLTVLKEYLS